MQLLLDANLSYRLVKKLTDLYADCVHVTRTGLPIPAEDIAIWQWAKANVLINHYEDLKSLHDSPDTGLLELF